MYRNISERIGKQYDNGCMDDKKSIGVFTQKLSKIVFCIVFFFKKIQ